MAVSYGEIWCCLAYLYLVLWLYLMVRYGVVWHTCILCYGTINIPWYLLVLEINAFCAQPSRNY